MQRRPSCDEGIGDIVMNSAIDDTPDFLDPPSDKAK
jgi:hypothetical protein